MCTRLVVVVVVVCVSRDPGEADCCNLASLEKSGLPAGGYKLRR